MKKYLKKVILKFIGLIEILTKTTITIRKVKETNRHPLAASIGNSMAIYCSILENIAVYIPKNIFEIGANFGQDAEFLRKRFGVDKSKVYIFEAHPQIVDEAERLYGFNSYALAISDKNGKAKFYSINLEKNSNSGISSLRTHNFNNKNDYIEIDVECMRMDKFIGEHNIDSIDFLKLDVEGANYEVLLGFGVDLDKVKAIQVEAENTEVWAGQYLYKDIAELLFSHNFELIYFELKDSAQSDSFWVKKNLIKQCYQEQIN